MNQQPVQILLEKKKLYIKGLEINNKLFIKAMFHEQQITTHSHLENMDIDESGT